MGEKLKQNIVELAKETHAALFETVEKNNLEIIIHKDSGWRGREMLSHIAAWDRELVKVLSEFLDGREYLTPEYDEDVFNGRAAEAQKSLSTVEIVEDWKLARKELIRAIEIIPADRFSGDLLYPWGDERGSIYDLIKYFCEHDLEHKQEIEDSMKDLN